MFTWIKIIMAVVAIGLLGAGCVSLDSGLLISTEEAAIVTAVDEVMSEMMVDPHDLRPTDRIGAKIYDFGGE